MRRRYATDYEVVTCHRYAHAQAILDGLRRWKRDVALILSFYGPRDREGLRLPPPGALDPPVRQAGGRRGVGQLREPRAGLPRHRPRDTLENLLIRPERPRDEEFHGGIGDLLHDWHWAQGTSGFEAVRIIGHHDERTHMLRDAFARNHIPVGFYEADEENSRRILRGLGLDDPEFPVLDLRFTSPPRALAEPERHRPRRGLRPHRRSSTRTSSGTR